MKNGGEQEKRPYGPFSTAHLLVQDREKGDDPVDEGDLLKSAITSEFQFKVKSTAILLQAGSEGSRLTLRGREIPNFHSPISSGSFGKGQSAIAKWAIGNT